MPLMKPSFAAMGIFVGMNSWNSFILPVLLLTKDNRTLPVFLETLLSPYKNNYDRRSCILSHTDRNPVRDVPEVFHCRHDSRRRERIEGRGIGYYCHQALPGGVFIDGRVYVTQQ